MKSISGYLRSQLLRRRLEKPPYVFTQRIEGITIKFSVHTWLEYHNRGRDSYTKEPDTAQWIKENLKSGDILWDIGANVGAYSLLAARLRGAVITAFEPYIPNFSHLWDNVVLNDCAEQITPLCLALSDHTEIDFLGVSDHRAGSSGHVLGGRGFKTTQPSIAIRGDDVLASFALKPPTHIKIDVDGYEMQVLKGMPRILRMPGLSSLLIETERGKTEEQVFNLLGEAGFERISDSSAITEGRVFNTVYGRA